MSHLKAASAENTRLARLTSILPAKIVNVALTLD
jgi:hypothetical protein